MGLLHSCSSFGYVLCSKRLLLFPFCVIWEDSLFYGSGIANKDDEDQ